jgi:hypothetical protein
MHFSYVYKRIHVHTHIHIFNKDVKRQIVISAVLLIINDTGPNGI